MNNILVLIPVSSFVRSELEKLGRVLDGDVHDMSAADRDAINVVVAAVPILAQNKLAPVDAKLMDSLKGLRLIANLGAGCDHIDLEGAAARGIKVTNTADALTEDTADTALGLVLNTIRQLNQAEQHVRTGGWLREPFPLTPSLRDYAMGIFGMGRIGRAIAKRLDAFGARISYHNRNPLSDVAYEYKGSLLELARSCDCLIVSAPATAQTMRSVNAEILDALGPRGLVVNIARGALIDEPALLEALTSGRVAGAGLDVFDNEPRISQTFLSLKNIVLLPHIGSATTTTRHGMEVALIDSIKSFAAAAS